MSQQRSVWTAQNLQNLVTYSQQWGRIFGPPLPVGCGYTTAPHSCTLIRTGGLVGVVKQLPTELLSGRQGSSLGMRRGEFEEHIPTPITQPPPSHKSLETSLVVQLTRTNGYHTQRHSKNGTSLTSAVFSWMHYDSWN
jgi:hypothetical protein